MAETNSEPATAVAPVADDDKAVTEDDLRALKYPKDGVEPEKEDEPSEGTEEETPPEEPVEPEEDQIPDAPEEEPEKEPQFVKQFPNIKGDTPEEYAKNLEKAYENSTAEFQRLRTEVPEDKPEGEPIETSNVAELYAKQKMDEEIQTAWSDFSKKYSQAVPGTPEYTQFTNEVSILSNTILQSQKRLASPQELYQKAAVILGWEPSVPTEGDKLKIALKDSASSSKTPQSAKKKSQSKVTDSMISVNRKMYPGKSDAEIREELEPYIT